MNRLLVPVFILVAAVVLMANNPASAQESVYTQNEKIKAFNAFDKNGDGKISKEEYTPRHENRFKELDKNADGYLTKEEYQEKAPEDKQKIQEGADRRRENIKTKIMQRQQSQ